MTQIEETDGDSGIESRILRALVVDDNENVRRSLHAVLSSQNDIRVICEAADGIDAISKARNYKPDIVLMDVTMPDVSGLEATRLIRQELPSSWIVIVSQHDPKAFRWAALSAGANGYVVKSEAWRDLIPELRKIQNSWKNTA
jgi:two-component system response regulator NreC